MVKKLNIDYVKSIIRQLGHEPLFDEYKNNNRWQMNNFVYGD